ncbi:hypothetical protein MW887_006620 [Aspergillus wentii]|nr:hypothetical protein MW887_006620 [Aspergillus wentii]
MSERHSRPSSPYLEPPSKSFEGEDIGVQESASNSDEEHFSDATEGNQHSHSRSPSGRTSPVPRTRVEKVDEDPSHGDVPGTPAYEKRGQDAVPDEIEVIPEGSRSRSHSAAGSQGRSPSPGAIPRTLVEKIDPSEPAHGEVPGTAAYEQRKADAVPDIVTTVPESDDKPPSPSAEASEPNAADVDVPETLLSRVDSIPNEDGKPRQRAHKRSPSDALPDSTETIQDVPDSTTSLSNSPENRDQPSLTESNNDHNDSNDDDAGNVDTENATHPGPSQDEAPMDDFDDFAEEQDDMGDDDFGDFDDGFQEGEIADSENMDQGDVNPPQPPPPSVPPLVEFDTFRSLPHLFAALESPLDDLFPASKNVSSLPPVEPIPNSSAIFSTERSLSLWSQLVAPPPLQPQNWVKSRIRRLFLVSLGVPVDLDEILPASKQKKLVLPSINLDGSESTSLDGPQGQAKKDGLQGGPENAGTSSTASRSRTSRRRDAPPPELDLSAVRRLCATTDAALGGLTEPELKGHVTELEQVTLRASTVLEYWLKRRDGLVSEKEAFEGVIENLVSHARRLRK